MRAWLITLAFVLLIVFGLYYYIPGAIQKVIATQAGPLDLSKSELAVELRTARPFFEGPEATFQAFLYLNPMLRTGVHVPNSMSFSATSSSDGSAAGPCPCPSGDCVSACPRPEYVKIFNISGIVALETLMAPDASRPGQASVQLTVKTEATKGVTNATGSGLAYFLETFVLPPIPYQKWHMITVAREGRRFDIYYNDKLVLSKKTFYMPVSGIGGSNSTGITSGSTTGLTGQIALINLYNYRLNSAKVYARYNDQTDTRGQPAGIVTDIPYGMVGMSTPSIGGVLGKVTSALDLCPDGGCLDAPTVRPASPLYDWTSEYE